MVGDEDEDGGGDWNADVNDNFYDVEKMQRVLPMTGRAVFPFAF